MRAITTRISMLAAAAAVGALLAGPAAAQQTANRVDAKQDWSVFTAEDDGKVCWIVTQPSRSRATRAGKPVKVKRGDIYLIVSVRPTKGVANEVSMSSGYPFKKGSTVTAKVGKSTFKMFTEGEGAWLASSDVDAKMVAAMIKGSAAVLSGVSGRGTKTTDTFSLRGFTAALKAAKALCR